MVDVTVKGLDRLAAKLARLPESLKRSQLEANQANADDFVDRVRAVVPKGEREPQLVSTLQKAEGTRGPLSVQVSIGGPAAPYPAHLEFGHMGPGGVHVQAEPFWYSTLRVNRRRFRGRQTRAATKALKALKAGGGGAE